MSQKKRTEKDYLLELERLCRIFAYQKIGDDELSAFKSCVRAPLEELAKIRAQKEKQKTAKKQGGKK